MSIEKDPREIILRPIVSEKSYSLIDSGSRSSQSSTAASSATRVHQSS